MEDTRKNWSCKRHTDSHIPAVGHFGYRVGFLVGLEHTEVGLEHTEVGLEYTEVGLEYTEVDPECIDLGLEDTVTVSCLW